ncbi:hypothetical protein BC834DRAFT_608074 [Gloeopeniophorella convolvens]|nr:hypothetical protein BC834DRAFT_608074 [Gloeopeniophorella convolvens]
MREAERCTTLARGPTQNTHLAVQGAASCRDSESVTSLITSINVAPATSRQPYTPHTPRHCATLPHKVRLTLRGVRGARLGMDTGTAKVIGRDSICCDRTAHAVSKRVRHPITVGLLRTLCSINQLYLRRANAARLPRINVHSTGSNGYTCYMGLCTPRCTQMDSKRKNNPPHPPHV